MEVKETFHLLLFCIGDSMNPYLLIVFLFFSLFGFEKIDGQNQFDGYWSGFITQVPAGISDRYFFSFEVQSDGAYISGKTIIRIEEDMEIFGEMSFAGTWNGQQFKFLETEITNEKIYAFAYWCKKSITLAPFLEKNKWVLRGIWKSDVCPGTGEIFLVKPDAL